MVLATSMFITVTSLRLRSLWGFFRLSWLGLKISLQARKSKGFVQMKNTGFGYLHFTASLWESEEDLKAFARTGAHLAAMRQGSSLASEIRTHTYAGARLPSWKEVRALLHAKAPTQPGQETRSA